MGVPFFFTRHTYVVFMRDNKEMDKRRDARAKLSFSLQKPIAFLLFSLPSRSANPLA